MNVTASREFEVNPAEGSVTPAEASPTTPDNKDNKTVDAAPKTGQPKTKRSGGKIAAPKNAAAKSTDAAAGASNQPHTFRAGSKAEIILKKLKTAKGVTIDELVEATGWQSHSVRGFMSGTVKKKLGLEVASEPGKDGVRRYRIANGNPGA